MRTYTTRFRPALRTTCLAVLGITTCSLAGCADDDGSATDTTPATRADYDDMAQSMSKVVVTDSGGGELGAMADVMVVASGDVPFGFSLDASGAFHGNHLGVEYTYALSCYDADGDEQPVCDGATDHADAQVHWAGELSLPRFDGSIERDGAWSLSALQEPVAVLSGDGDFALSTEVRGSDGAPQRTYDLAYTADYDEVLLDTETHEAVGGSIHYAIVADRMVDTDRTDVEAHFEMDAVITFEADGDATLVIDGDQRYAIDADTGAVIRL